MFTKDQIRKFRSALAVAVAEREKLEKLLPLGLHSPAFKNELDGLIIRADYTETMARTALAVAEQQDGG